MSVDMGVKQIRCQRLATLYFGFFRCLELAPLRTELAASC